MHSQTIPQTLPLLCQPPVGPPPILGFYLLLYIGMLLKGLCSLGQHSTGEDWVLCEGVNFLGHLTSLFLEIVHLHATSAVDDKWSVVYGELNAC